MSGFEDGVVGNGSTSVDQDTTDGGQGQDLSQQADQFFQKMENQFQSLVGKWGNKIGEITKNASQVSNTGEQSAAPSEDLLTELVENPDAFVQKKVSDLLTQQVRQQQEAASQRNAFISERMPDFNDVRGDMLQSLSDDGVPQHQASQLLDSLDNAQLNSVYRRAKAEAENRQLKRTIEQLKKQGVNLSDPSLQAAGRGSTGENLDSTEDALAGVDLRSMSAEQKQQLYKKYLNKS